MYKFVKILENLKKLYNTYNFGFPSLFVLNLILPTVDAKNLLKKNRYQKLLDAKNIDGFKY